MWVPILTNRILTSAQVESVITYHFLLALLFLVDVFSYSCFLDPATVKGIVRSRAESGPYKLLNRVTKLL